MSVYTKTGDSGLTSLYTGERIPKNSLRVKAYGTVDEMNSALAMARAATQNQKVRDIVLSLQKNNAMLMADLASINKEPLITTEKVSELEKIIDEIEVALPPLSSFLIPGESLAGAYLDLARTIARRAERSLLDLTSEEMVHSSDSIYINRLSDLCFVLMRLEENR